MTILEQVIEQVVSVVDTRAMSPIQDSIVDTARSSQQNGGILILCYDFFLFDSSC